MELVAFLCLLCSPQGIPPELAARAFDEALELSERDGGALWGHELYGPMLFLDGATGTMVANQPDDRGLLAEAGFVFAGPLGDELGLANTAQPWAGVTWTTVLWPLPTEATDRRRLLAHELTHRLQPTLGACRFAQRACAHLDEKDGRVLLRLEMRALAAALGATGEARTLALTDALAARVRRYALFPDAREAEVALESNEGVAEYTGVKLCGLDPAAQLRHAAARLRGAETERTFARSFAYATGPAWGLLIDAADVAAGAESWRAGFDGTIAFHERARQAYGLGLSLDPAADVEQAVEQALTRHEGVALRAEEEQREQARQATITLDRARLVDGPLLILRASPGIRYQFDPYAVRTLPGLGEVYETLTTSDAWGELTVQAGGALMTRDARGGVESVRVPAPTSTDGETLTGEGWTLRLAAGWRLGNGARPGDHGVER